MINEDMLSGLVEHFNGTVEIQPRNKVVKATPPPTKSRRHRGRPPVEASQKVTDAKHELMTRFGVSEEVAHRLVQRFAMECRIPFEYAADMVKLGLKTLDILAEDGH